MSYYVVHDELYHHGIFGQKWGVRRYQNSDGSLTAQGKKRYGGNSYKELTREGKKKYKTDIAITKKLRKAKSSADSASAEAENYRANGSVGKFFNKRVNPDAFSNSSKANLKLSESNKSHDKASKIYEKKYGKKLRPDDFVEGYTASRKKMASNFVEKEKGERAKDIATQLAVRTGISAVSSLATVPTLGLVIIPNVVVNKSASSKYKIKE